MIFEVNILGFVSFTFKANFLRDFVLWHRLNYIDVDATYAALQSCNIQIHLLSSLSEIFRQKLSKGIYLIKFIFSPRKPHLIME